MKGSPEGFSRRSFLKKATLMGASLLGIGQDRAFAQRDTIVFPGDPGYKGPNSIERDTSISAFLRRLKTNEQVLQSGSGSQITQLLRRAPQNPHYNVVRGNYQQLTEYYPPFNPTSFTEAGGKLPWPSTPAQFDNLHRVPVAERWFRERDVDPRSTTGTRTTNGLLVSPFFLAGAREYDADALRAIEHGAFAVLLKNYSFPGIAHGATSVMFSNSDPRALDCRYASATSMVRVRGGVEGQQSTEDSGREIGKTVSKNWITTFPTGVLLRCEDRPSLKRLLLEATMQDMTSSYPLRSSDVLRLGISRLLDTASIMIATDADPRESSYVKFGGGLGAPVFAQKPDGSWDTREAVGLLVASFTFSGADGSDLRAYIVLDGRRVNEIVKG